MITVCKFKDPHDVYIGRGSKWGNPFIIGKDGSRAQVIDKYQEYLLDSPKLMAALPELINKRLGCFCAPLACHGDVLKFHADKLGDGHGEDQTE